MLAERSGGAAIFPDNILTLGKSFDKLHDLIRSRYFVAINPPILCRMEAIERSASAPKKTENICWFGLARAITLGLRPPTKLQGQHA